MEPSRSIQTPTENIKQIIAANIAELRRAHNMTQLDLAERLNYTDKAISKWERGESLPDVTVLKAIADLFGVTVDYLLSPTHDPKHAEESQSQNKSKNLRARGFIMGMSVMLVWLAATVLFVVFDMIPGGATAHWIVFVYAIPASFIVWLVLNSVWFNRRRNYLIISLLMWSTLLMTFLSVFCFSGYRYYIWQIFLLGLPGQAIIVMWSHIKSSLKK